MREPTLRVAMVVVAIVAFAAAVVCTVKVAGTFTVQTTAAVPYNHLTLPTI